MKINEKFEGQIFNLCMNLWEQINKSPSVRITALKFIIRIVQNHPELKDELVFITQEHYLETLSAGVKRSVEKLLSDIN